MVVGLFILKSALIYEQYVRSQAVNWYTQGRHADRLAECHYLLEDFENLENVSCASDDKQILQVMLWLLSRESFLTF